MKNNKQLGIYIHIPFCVRKCAYCDFLSDVADDAVKKMYIDALKREISMTADKYPELKEREVTSVFLGGGTPSVIDSGYICDIVNLINECFKLSEFAEITIECNPGTVNEEKLLSYRECGINRLSFGIQSANDDELVMLGRIHSYGDAVQSIELAGKCGFYNINADIMTALPAQTPYKLENTLRAVMALDVRHISAYSLIVEKGTHLYNNIGDYPPLPDEDMDRHMYSMTREILCRNGYKQYEISNYAREGFECVHNLLYWDRGEYLGFGIGASGFMGKTRYSNIRNLSKYLNCNSLRDVRGEIETLTLNDEMEEFMFLGLRRLAGIDACEFYNRFGMDIESVYKVEIESNIAKGLLKKEGSRIMLTSRGIDISNYVMSDFILTC